MRERRIFLIFGVMIFAIIFRIPTLYTEILDIDESQYGEFALKVLGGGKPYESSIGEKPPLLYYHYIGVFKFFGKNNYLALHWVSLIWVLMSIYGVYRIGLFQSGRIEVGLVAGLFYAIFSTAHEPKIISTNGETLMNLPLIWGIYCLLLSDREGRGVVRYLILSGFLTGLGFLYRHQAGVQVVVLCLYILLRVFFGGGRLSKEGKLSKRRIWECVWIFLGFSIPVGVTIVLMVRMGVYEDFLFWNWTFNLRYIESGHGSISWVHGFFRLFVFGVFTFPCWYFLGRSFRIYFPKLIAEWRAGWRAEWKKDGFLSEFSLRYLWNILWLLMSLFPVFLGGRFYSHYFIQIFPALFLMGGLGAKRLSKRWMIVCIIYGLIFLIPRLDADLTNEWIKKVSMKQARLGVYPEQKVVGEYIRKNTEEGEKVIVWGFATPIYVYADREAGSRLSWMDFLSGRIPGEPIWGGDMGSGNILNELWDDFCVDMNRYQPVYFVDTSPGDYHEYGDFPIGKEYGGFDLEGFIEGYFEREKNIEGMVLYRRIREIDLECGE